jgi:hypothetical protein
VVEAVGSKGSFLYESLRQIGVIIVVAATMIDKEGVIDKSNNRALQLHMSVNI